MIAFPPLAGKGCPMLGQNRQFQLFSNACYIYPMVPASAATLLKANGYDVLWEDSIAEEKTEKDFLDKVKSEKPNLIAIETKTPVVQLHWKIIEKLKSISEGNWPLAIVLFGDHVTALPEESFQNSKVDYVITGGDYDFLLLNLCKNLTLDGNKIKLSPSGLETGIWYRDNGAVKSTGKFELNHDLNSLPFVDRQLTKWLLYSEKNGNYKKTPGTYTMVGRDCWYHKCTFCSWTTTYSKFRVRKPESLLDEIGSLIELGVKEIMDDTGSFPTGQWLDVFCKGMIERGYNKFIKIDCNMRFGALSIEEYKLMKKAGFRLMLFGLESANQKTLDIIKKGVTVETIVESCKNAGKAGLYPHLTIMFGYPWETYEDVKATVNLGRFLLKKGYAYTLQSTMVVPYPGTPLFADCKEKGLLNTLDWERYDMREAIMKTTVNEVELKEAVKMVYKVAFDPEFVLRKILSIRDFYDLKFFAKAAKSVLGHLTDFGRSKK